MTTPEQRLEQEPGKEGLLIDSTQTRRLDSQLQRRAAELFRLAAGLSIRTVLPSPQEPQDDQDAYKSKMPDCLNP